MILTKQILILPKEKYLFFLNPKCASSSIRRMAIFDLKYEEPLSYVTDLKDLSLYLDFKWFMVIREPWGRLQSLWRDKVYRRVHHDFRRFNFCIGGSFSDFAKRFKDINELTDYGMHLWPMFSLLPYFSKGRSNVTNIIIDVKDWNNWPNDLPSPRYDNESKITKIPEKEVLDLIGLRILQSKYKVDFDNYEYI